MKVEFEDLYSIYVNEVRKNVKNKVKVFKFEEQKIEYLLKMKEVLEQGKYDGGKYNIFIIHFPKVRLVMSQGIYDKIINHYIARNILMPKLEKYLDERNVATRKNMGSKMAIKYIKSDYEWSKNFNKCYVLKMDIKKYFPNIDHEVIKDKLKCHLTNEEYKLISNILNSTNASYINERIKSLQKTTEEEIPLYLPNKGLNLGSMTSQFLAVYYLSDLHHFMRHNLGLKHFVCYMDDYIVFHPNLTYLKQCKKIIEEKLKNEYKLELNEKKCFITSTKNGIEFLGYVFKFQNKKTQVKLANKTKRKVSKNISRKTKEYNRGQISFQNYFSAIETYKGGFKEINKRVINNIIEKYI